MVIQTRFERDDAEARLLEFGSDLAPVRLRLVASGLIIEKVRSIAIGLRSLRVWV